MQKLPEVRRDYLAKIVDAVKEDLRSRSEEDMEVDYPDMDKQVDELCSQFERLSL